MSKKTIFWILTFIIVGAIITGSVLYLRYKSKRQKAIDEAEAAAIDSQQDQDDTGINAKTVALNQGYIPIYDIDYMYVQSDVPDTMLVNVVRDPIHDSEIIAKDGETLGTTIAIYAKGFNDNKLWIGFIKEIYKFSGAVNGLAIEGHSSADFVNKMNPDEAIVTETDGITTTTLDYTETAYGESEILPEIAENQIYIVPV